LWVWPRELTVLIGQGECSLVTEVETFFMLVFIVLDFVTNLIVSTVKTTFN
jgi:hypothetical protein